MRRPSTVWRWPYSPEQSVLDHRNKTEVLVRMEHLLSYKSYKQKELIIQTNLTVEELDIIATSKFFRRCLLFHLGSFKSNMFLYHVIDGKLKRKPCL